MPVIFDCDGVLVDTETISARILSEALGRQGIALGLPEVFARFRGRSTPDCIRLVGERLAERDGVPLRDADHAFTLGEPFWREVQAATLSAFEQGVEPVPGINQVLDSLDERGETYCVASNGAHEKMQLSLTRAGLIDRLPRRFSATEVAEGKPAPDLFLLAARALGAEPSQCVVVEDSPSGARAARAAGMTLLGYCPPLDGEPDREAERAMEALGGVVFRDMKLLPALLAELSGAANSAV